MKCKSVREMLAAYEAGDLYRTEQAEVQAHLAACAACRAELAEISRVPAMLQKLEGDPWWADVRQGVREALTAAERGAGRKSVRGGIKEMRFMLKPVALGLLALAVVLTGVVAGMRYDRGIAQWVQPGTAPWPTFQHDMQRTGRSEYVGPSSPEVRWRLSDMSTDFYAAAIGPDGLVYALDLNSLRALTPYGEERWQVKGGDAYPSVSSDGTIYFVAGPGTWLNPDPDRPTMQLYALNADGTTKWKYGVDQGGGYPTQSPAIGPDGTIYFGSGRVASARDEEGLVTAWEDAAFYAIRPDGVERWRFSQKDLMELSSAAIATDGTVYVTAVLWGGGLGHHESSSDSTDVLYAFTSEGQIKWQLQLGRRHQDAPMPAIGADGTIYVIYAWQEVIALREDGSEKWRWRPGTWLPGQLDGSGLEGIYPTTALAIGADGTIYVGSTVRNPAFVGKDPDTGAPAYGGVHRTGKLYALRQDGTELWSFATEGIIEVPPIVDAAGTIYVSDSIEYGNSDPTVDDGTVYAVNPDGTEKWRFKTGSQVEHENALVIGHDGTLYVGAKWGRFYALREAR